MRTIWLTFPGLAGALAALFVPGATSPTAAGGALVAMGALALLAGHAWGASVSVPSHVALAGHVWPDMASAPSPATRAAIVIVLVTALPALALLRGVLRETATDLVGERRPRARNLFLAIAAAGLVAALVLPALR